MVTKLKKENELMLELCKFKDYDARKIASIIKSGIDYPYVLGHLLFNRVGSIAYYVLKKCDLLEFLSREFRNVIYTIYLTDISKANAFQNGLSLLGEIFKDAKFPYAFLKGSYLSSIYPKGLRTSNDYDILVNQRDLTEICNLLKDNNFVQGKYIPGKGIIPATRRDVISSRMNRGETVPFLKQSYITNLDIMEIDINFSLDFKAKQENNTVEKILGNTEDLIKINNSRIYTLSKIDFIIHLCIHLYKEASIYNWVSMSRDLALYKFCDLYLFIHEFGCKDLYDELYSNIKNYGLQKECYYSIYYTKVLFSIDNTELSNFLLKLEPKDKKFLNQILRPSDGKVFTYDMDYVDWVFCSNKINRLE